MKRSGFDSPGRKPQDPAPPLRVWVAVLVLTVALAALVATTFTDATPPYKRRYLQYEETRLRSFAEKTAPEGHGKKVMALGSSLLACATFFDRDMDAFSLRSGQAQFNFLRITRPSMSFDQLPPLLDGILAAKPDILVIERNMVFYRPDPFILAADSYSQFVKTRIKETFFLMVHEYFKPELRGQTKPPNVLDSDAELDKMPFKKGPFELQRFTEERKTIIGPENFLNRNLVEAFLARASKCGIRIVLLDVPRSPEANALIPDSDKTLISSYADTYKKLYGVLSLNCPLNLGLEYYRDYSHLNSRGRVLYSQWLITRLGEIKTAGELP